MLIPSRRLANSNSAESRRAGAAFRRSAALFASAALTFAACSSGEDTVSPDAAPADAGVEQSGLQQNGPIEVDGAILDPFESTVDDIAIGMQAPVVRGQSFDGSEMVIGAPTENPTMIVFLAHWCPHCNAEVPVLLDLEAAGLLPEGLDVVGVSTAVVADRDNYPPSQWITDKGWSWPTMADDDALDAFGAFGGMGFPFTVVLDADGTVLARRSGEATGDATVAFLDAALSDATA